jgi:hypothetical protein
MLWHSDIIKVTMEITPALSGSQFPLADVMQKSPRFRYGMREPADILSCEFSLLNCDFDRAAKKAVKLFGRNDSPIL